uniref:R3H domain and coiled-coil containing 1 n=1 Tax=Amazona collaria TaxID=241587 RepID=A0A8B9IXW2_9PSIT
MDGVFLSPNEDEFVGRITEELEHFVLQGQLHSVLLFPPLSSRLRYLIHRTVDSMDLLSSFSVGEGWRRRTVICHAAVRLPTETSDQKPSTNPLRPARAPQPWGRGSRGGRLRHPGDIHGDNPRASVGSGRIRRPTRKKPDKALYVPKAMRKREEWGEQENLAAAAGDVAQEEATCPKETAQEELGRSEGSSGMSLCYRTTRISLGRKVRIKTVQIPFLLYTINPQLKQKSKIWAVTALLYQKVPKSCAKCKLKTKAAGMPVYWSMPKPPPLQPVTAVQTQLKQSQVQGHWCWKTRMRATPLPRAWGAAEPCHCLKNRART